MPYRLRYAARQDFAVNALFEVSVVFSEQTTTVTFYLHDGSAFSSRERSLQADRSKQFVTGWGHDWLSGVHFLSPLSTFASACMVSVYRRESC